jgi:hypothetical protein
VADAVATSTAFLWADISQMQSTLVAGVHKSGEIGPSTSFAITLGTIATSAVQTTRLSLSRLDAMCISGSVRSRVRML